MKIFLVTNSREHWKNIQFKGSWAWYPEYWEKQGHQIEFVYQKKWLKYLSLLKKTKPSIIVSIGKEAGIITAIHWRIHKIISKIFKTRRIPFVFIFNDHPYFYKSERRLRFILKNHDKIFTASKEMQEQYNCDEYVPFGSFLIDSKKVPKGWIKKQIYDCGYAGQTHAFYNVENIKNNLEKENIKLHIISELPEKKQVAEEISRCKVCIFPISWQSSGKTQDYSLLGKAVVAIKPNYLEKINYPALYTENITEGVKELLKNTDLRKKLEKENKQWYIENSLTASEQSDRFMDLFKKYIKLFSTDKN